jgi:hypothetical protein
MTSAKRIAACLLAAAGCLGLMARGVSDSVESKADAQPVVAAPQECHGQNQTNDPVLPDFVESDSDQLTELNKYDGPIEGDANWAVDDAGNGDDATEPQDAAPVVDDYASVKWIGSREVNPLAPTLTLYTRTQGCDPCLRLHELLKDEEVVKQSRSWNMRCVIVLSNTPTPAMQFRSPANAGRVVTLEFPGCPPTPHALATLLYESWAKVMPPPEKSVVKSRHKLFSR